MLQEYVLIFAKLAIVFLGLSLGLKAPISETGFLWRRPGLALRSLIAVDVLVPLIALAIVLWLPLPRAARIGLLLMAVSPGAPFIPMKSVHAGAEPIFVYGLQITITLLAVVTTPLSLELLGRFFNVEVSVSFWAVTKIMVLAQLVPLIAGIAIRYFLPKLADRITPGLSLIAVIMLGLLTVLILIRGFSFFLEMGIYTWIAIVLLAIGAMLFGHLLGGPAGTTRTGLAIASVTRHPGLALFLALHNFPEVKAGPTIIAYLLASAIVGIPYIRWRKNATRRESGALES